MDELDEAVKDILELCPKQISPQNLAIIIANIVNIYGFSNLWPMVSAHTYELLGEHAAVDDADDFLNRITKGKMH